MKGKVGRNGVFKDLVVRTDITRVGTQRVFLPVYSARYSKSFQIVIMLTKRFRYEHNGKWYNVLMNGQTGELYGERPYAFGKWAAVIFLLSLPSPFQLILVIPFLLLQFSSAGMAVGILGLFKATSR
jgi:hypothetical protein